MLGRLVPMMFWVVLITHRRDFLPCVNHARTWCVPVSEHQHLQFHVLTLVTDSSSCELHASLRFPHVACCGSVIEGWGKELGERTNVSAPRRSSDKPSTAINVQREILVSHAVAHRTVTSRMCKSSERGGCVLSVQLVNIVEWHTLHTHTHPASSIPSKSCSPH